jgi:predicted  nucleic acid-binding Zn-ribbon protein
MKNPCCEQIGALIQIQETDAEIIRINTALALVDGRIRELDQKLQSFNESIRSREADAETVRKKIKDYELEILECQKRIDRGQAHVKNITTNKEYQAVLKEIEEAKKRKSSLEDRQLELMEELEKTVDDTENLRKDYVQLESFVSSQKDDIIKASETERMELEKLGAKRLHASEVVDPSLLTRYDKILKIVGRKAVAGVAKSVCGGCHMNIPPQMFIELQKCKEIMYCPRCQRIIYWSGCIE